MQQRKKDTGIIIFYLGLIISMGLVISGALNEDRNALDLQLIGFSVFVLFAAASIRFNLHHPFFWFNGIFWLYSIASPILYLIGFQAGSSAPDITSHIHAVFIEYAAVVVFSVAVGVKKVVYKNISLHNLETLANGSIPFMFISFFISLIMIFMFYRLGITDKIQKYDTGSYATNISFVFTFILVGFCFYYLRNLHRYGKQPYKILCLLVIYFFIAYLVIGERGIFFRMIVVITLLYTTTQKNINKSIIVAFLVTGIVLSTLMGYTKNLLVKPDISSFLSSTQLINIETPRDILYILLGSEFRSASDNMASLVSMVPESIPFFLGRSTWWEIKSSMRIGVLADRESAMSSAVWFAQTFYPGGWDKGKGYGFALVGQGYLDFGLIGVILLFLILGLIIGFIYRQSCKNVLYFVFYINLVPIVMYSVRQSIAPIISQSLKHIVLPMFLMFCMGTIISVASKSREVK
ncbi:MAG: O-antigen polymerase [Syntrophaceae bacterium]